MIRLAVDIGGTFTDIVLDNEGVLTTHKILSTPHAPERGALAGITRLLEAEHVSLSDVTLIIHGTTLATNALIERRGAKTAFVTTAGFRDVLQMRNEKRFDQYALDIVLPEPLVPRNLRIGIAERMLSDGTVRTAPDMAEIDAVADTLKRQKIEAVAVGLLHAYRNNAHERIVAHRLRHRLDASVTICQSAEVANEINEFTRFSTVCANAYVRPLMSRYLAHFETILHESGFVGAFLMMSSGGGVTTLDQARLTPIRLVESGPAGGAALAAHIAKRIGSDRTLSLDIGGTTAKMCFVDRGAPQTTRQFEIARAWRNMKGSGLPVRVPTIEMVEIGAGGGSIAHADQLGRLAVGPHSAGSAPGPAAYCLGGRAATVTDAHLAVGHIAADSFGDGAITLDRGKAADAIDVCIARKLSMASVETAAAGILEIADEKMANAARVHGIELGKDIGRYDLLVSGGGGALHACRIAEKLGIRRVIVPAFAGVGSAIGFLHTPVAFEEAITVLECIDTIDPEAILHRINAAEIHVRKIVAGAAPEQHIEIRIVAELRYLGQAKDFHFPLDLQGDFARTLDRIASAFTDTYRKQHGFTLDDIAIELVGFSVMAHVPQSSAVSAPDRVERAAVAPSHHAIFDLSAEGWENATRMPRDALARGDQIQGPALVTEEQTTTVLRPGWTLTCAEAGHLLLEREGAT